MNFNSIIYLILLASVVLACFGIRQNQGSWKFVTSLVGSFLTMILGILVPAFYFFMSGALAPSSKLEAAGPLSLLIETKIILWPLALWAWASFYLSEIIRKRPLPSWATLGLFSGVLGCFTCLASLFFLKKLTIKVEASDVWALMWFLPPIYIPIWYGIAAYRGYRSAKVEKRLFTLASLLQGSWWILAAQKTHESYNNLAATSHDCFVVTASCHGYQWLTCPYYERKVDGQYSITSRQLKNFRDFEALWQKSFPKFHHLFRFVYNLIGPRLAALIASPLRASLAYILLKPFEGLIVLILLFNKEAQTRKNPSSPR